MSDSFHAFLSAKMNNNEEKENYHNTEEANCQNIACCYIWSCIQFSTICKYFLWDFMIIPYSDNSTY